MYNEELKERFLSSVTESEHTRNVYRGIFHTSGKTEEKLGKDVCAMTPEEGREIAEEIIGLRGESRAKRLYLLKQYVKWCVREGVEGASLDFLEVKASDFAGIREKMVSGPEDLKRRLDDIFGRSEEDSVRNTYRCYLWLGYMEIPEEDAVAMKTSDVDLISRTVSVRGETTRIPDAAMHDFRSCATLTEFVLSHPGYGKTSYVKRYGGDLLLRGLRSEPAANAMRASVAKAQMGRESRLSYTAMSLSGYFRRTFERERAGIEPDFAQTAVRTAKESAERNGVADDQTYVNHRRSVIEKSLREDYERWKFIFS